MSKYGMTVGVCLLCAGGLIGGPTSVGPLATADAAPAPGLPASTLNPDYAPVGVNVHLPQSYQEDAVIWSSRAAKPGVAVYRGNRGAFERGTDTSFLYAIGGQLGGYPHAQRECYRYNSRTNMWQAMARLLVPSSNMTAVYWQDDGGGADSSGVFQLGIYDHAIMTDCYKWTKATNTWASIAPYADSQQHAGNMACVVGDSIFLVWNKSSFSRYSIRQGTWASRSSPPTGAFHGAMCASQGKVYQLDGFRTTAFQCYDPVAGTWSTKAAACTTVGGNSGALAAWDVGALHRVYAWGGGTDWKPRNGVAWYDAGTNVWTMEGTIPERVLGAFFGPLQEFPGPIEGLHHTCGYSRVVTTAHRRGVPEVPPGLATESPAVGRLSFSIAPNPLGGSATVRYSLPRAGLATLNVFDVTGRTVLTQTMAAGRTGTASLDLRELKAGVYAVKVTTEGFVTTQKLVVEH